jgi:hypothetical protein
MTMESKTTETTETTETTVVMVAGVTLRRHESRGPRGGRRYTYQSVAADPLWGYWYDSARDAARRSNASDRIVAAGM